MPYNKKIKVVNNGKEKTLVKTPEQTEKHNDIVFSFSYFNGQSIRWKNFNNFYASEADAKKAVDDFFKIIREISKMDTTKFFSANVKKQLHYNEFDDNDIIDRIESILMYGYYMPKKKVEEFERLYFEFSFNNGKRVIGTKIDKNILSILFIDCNHLVCPDSSRMLKIKEGFNYPGLFEQVVSSDDIKQYGELKLLNELVTAARNGEYKTVSEFVKDYDELTGVTVY